jgi:two-component system sensor histidine kinase DegS
MSEDKSTSKNIIYTSNKEMLDYFNNLFLNDLEDIQELKTQIFEIDVHIDELQKTKNIYAFKSSSRRSVFTPVSPEALLEDESNYIQEQIKELEEEKAALENKLRTFERSVNNIKRKINNLQDARTAIINAGLIEEADLHSSITDADDDGLQFVEKEGEQARHTHNYNVLMQEAFDNSFVSTMLTKSVVDKLSSTNHKLDTVSSLITTDPNRARLTTEEIIKENEDIASSVRDIINRLEFPVDTRKPIYNILNEFVTYERGLHSEIVIDAEVECTNHEMNLHPVFTINLVKLLNIFFDNIYKHANANHIDFRLSLTPNVIDVKISDNGCGISDNYLSSSPWYSSLHRATEIIYMLDGHISINGQPSVGTEIKFSFPIRN